MPTKTYDLPPLCGGYPETPHAPRPMVKSGFAWVGTGEKRHQVQVHICLDKKCGRRTTKNNGEVK